MVLMTSLSWTMTTPWTGTVIFCERSPSATALVDTEMSVGYRRGANTYLADACDVLDLRLEQLELLDGAHPALERCGTERAWGHDKRTVGETDGGLVIRHAPHSPPARQTKILCRLRHRRRGGGGHDRPLRRVWNGREIVETNGHWGRRRLAYRSSLRVRYLRLVHDPIPVHSSRRGLVHRGWRYRCIAPAPSLLRVRTSAFVRLYTPKLVLRCMHSSCNVRQTALNRICLPVLRPIVPRQRR